MQRSRHVAERVARHSYGRLLAFLCARSRDIAGAEDALSEAFTAALAIWPERGVPANPEAWLLTAARRRLFDATRRREVRARATPDLLLAAEEAEERAAEPGGLADERLKLMLIAAHPDIEPSIRTPLMLQTVLRLEAGRIASAFCVSPAAMARRLTRAKDRIRLQRIPFELPDADELAPRLDAVLEAIYAAYGSGWSETSASGTDGSLAVEALYLGGLVAALLPRDPEALGLLALMLHCEARREARWSPEGGFIPLGEQDCRLWDATMIENAENHLASAASIGRIGRFQLEAAIQSAHAQRAATGQTDWEAVALLYEGLVRIAPTIGARVGRASAVCEARDPATALRLLDELPASAVTSYQPYWAVRAHLLARLGNRLGAADAYRRAIGLCADARLRTFLQRKLTALAN